MFAKLKKKIENESGASLNSESPGKTTQHRRDSVSSLPRAGSYQHLGPSPPGSITSEDSSMRDVSNPRDELAILLQRKTEQCKKLEGNISDLAALIKDKSKTIDKLELVIKQSDDVTNKKLHEQKEEFERYRDKLIEGYQNDKLRLEKLLNTEEALASCRSELETKSRQCHAAETQVEKLTDELGPLKQRLSALEADNHKLKEENNERAELVISLSKDKSAFDKRLDEMNREMTEKLGQICKLQEQLSDLDSEYKTLIRNSDLHRNKTSKLLEEKDDQIDTLQERVKLLEQRLSDSGLSGDERTSALNAERDSMEQKLAEARQQLTEVKSTWSDKISHLEEQISHLNAKIVEDSEELTNNQNITEQMRASFHKQIEDLREKLADAENRALENLELASSKATHYEKQIEELESEMRRMKLVHEDKEAQHKASILSLESQLSVLQAKNQQDQDGALIKNTQLEERLTDLLNRETSLQEQVTDLTLQINQLNNLLSEKDEEISNLKQQIIDSRAAAGDQNKTVSSLNEQLSQKVRELELAERVREDIEKHWQATEIEKGGLLERNADLHKQIQVLKSSNSDSKLELQRTLELKLHAMESLQKTEAVLRQKVEALEKQIEQHEINKAESGLYSDRIDEMNDMIAALQSKLAEKNRMLKKQEQTLKDLRTTLQRELKVQSLPNDEALDQTGNNTTSSTSPSLSRRYDAYQQQQSLQHNYSQPNLLRNNNSTGNPTAAVLPVQFSSSNMMTLTSSSSSVPSGATDALTAHTTHVKRELDKDVNFQYLKHVVLKFMLSRESEAIQLIKAVSMLLNFTHQEQQLIKDTLEWKMSWFGHRPPLGKGQTSKVIPPTL